jgi:hypothetical protein
VASKAALRSAPSSAAALLEAVGIAAGQDDAGALGAGSAGGFEPDAGAAADHDDGLPGQFRFALGGRNSGGSGHDPSNTWCSRRIMVSRPGRARARRNRSVAPIAQAGERPRGDL